MLKTNVLVDYRHVIVNLFPPHELFQVRAIYYKISRPAGYSVLPDALPRITIVRVRNRLLPNVVLINLRARKVNSKNDHVFQQLFLNPCSRKNTFMSRCNDCLNSSECVIIILRQQVTVIAPANQNEMWHGH